MEAKRSLDTPKPALIINSGSVPGLLSCWSEGVVRPVAGRRPIAAEAAGVGAPIAWFPLDEKPARQRRRAAVLKQVELCSLGGFSERVVIKFDPPAHANIPDAIGTGGRDTAMLISAAVEAASLGLSRVIWPVHAGAAAEISVEILADICDRAMLVGELVGLDIARASADGGGLRIETPYADLTDSQIMDLALDMDAPLSAAWWCMNEDAHVCGHCAGCMRWREALATVDPAGRLDLHVLATSPENLAPVGPLKQSAPAAQ